jgi:hypothetical protein
MQLGGLHLGKKDGVVAGDLRGNQGAIELHQASFQQGRTPFGKAKGDA